MSRYTNNRVSACIVHETRFERLRRATIVYGLEQTPGELPRVNTNKGEPKNKKMLFNLFVSIFVVRREGQRGALLRAADYCSV